MDRYELTRTAREAGVNVGIKTIDKLEVFARLVANKEREACAMICDDLHNTWRFGDGEDSLSGPKECAITIRERSNVELRGAALLRRPA